MDGKIVLVTGAARGIGEAIALQCAEEGATVVVTDVDVEDGQKTANRIEQIHGSTTFRQLDVTSSGGFNELVDEIVDQFGTINCLFNNAGVVYKNNFIEIKNSDMQRMLDVNLWGVWNGCQATIPTMMNSKGGSIVNISSIGGIRGIPHSAAYALPKAAVNHLTRVLAAELGPHDIRVNTVCPGSVNHGMKGFNNNSQQAAQKKIAKTPLRRLAQPKEIASAAVFLASENASFVTGQSLIVDGGRTITV